MHKLSFLKNTQLGPYFSLMKTFLDIVTQWALVLGDTQVIPVSRARTPFTAFLTRIGPLLLVQPLGQSARYPSQLAWELRVSL